LSVLLDNLIVNGIKYNRDHGRVTVSISRGNGEVVIAVTDTGVGIPQKYRGAIFDEFFRIREDGAPQPSGTGLGLPICKRIAAELGGTIEVESTENVGSTFRVRLPLYVSGAEHRGDAA
ncbi:MAG TPA: ATP-binding protein, partial [Longimicrobiales bacterium]|nr:ATP-binding protein [Longimicrobiales bacterium]